MTVWALTVAGVAFVTWQVIHTAGRGVLDDSSGPALAESTMPTPSPSPDSIGQPAHPQPSGPGTGPSSTATSPATPSSVSSETTPTSRPTSTPPHPSDSHGPSTAPSHSSSPGSPTSAPAHPTKPPAPAVDSWRGDAGVLTVSCGQGRIRLLGATPADGYQVEVEQEDDKVQAHFQREDPEDEVEVVARCVAGVPQFQVEQDERPHGDAPDQVSPSALVSSSERDAA